MDTQYDYRKFFGADVCVYRDQIGYVCAMCRLSDDVIPPHATVHLPDFRAGTADEMIEHLLVHRRGGDKVPEDVFDDLRAEGK